jgi:hypothetical protein
MYEALKAARPYVEHETDDNPLDVVDAALRAAEGEVSE